MSKKHTKDATGTMKPAGYWQRKRKAEKKVKTLKRLPMTEREWAAGIAGSRANYMTLDEADAVLHRVQVFEGDGIVSRRDLVMDGALPGAFIVTLTDEASAAQLTIKRPYEVDEIIDQMFTHKMSKGYDRQCERARMVRAEKRVTDLTAQLEEAQNLLTGLKALYQAKYEQITA